MRQNKDLPVQIRTITFAIFFLFLVFITYNLFFVPDDHSKSEGSTLKLSSDGSKTGVFIQDSETLIPISTASANHNEAFSRGDFIVWVEESQYKSEKVVVRYHVPTQTTIYITSLGSSQKPKVSTEGYVVWQEWIGETWQIFYFDGFTSKQITHSSSSSFNPDIFENTIVYARKDDSNTWNTIEFSLQNNTEKVVKSGIEAKNPYFYGTKLFFR